MEDKPKPEAQRIQQESHGANSPNIVGNQNIVTSVSVNAGRRLSEAQKLSLLEQMSRHAGSKTERGFSGACGAMQKAFGSLWILMDFVEAFRSAGWDLPGRGYGQCGPGHDFGL